jgi:DNA sulfur modification protein DndD
MFLQDLYGNDFTGTIKILEMQNGRCESFLTDGDGTRIFNPGSTLKLAYLMSLLLAIGKMMYENEGNEMPLIYDGSVSRFDIATGNSLLDCSTRQMIVLTRDYLMFDRDSNKVVNLEKIKKHSCTVYQLEKKRPFDSRRLGTMQTVVKRLQ